MSGGTVIAPWEVDDLPDDWIETLLGMGVDLPTMKSRQQAIDKVFDRARRKHPQYGQRYKH